MKKLEIGDPYRNADPAGRSLAAAARSIPVVDGRETLPAPCEGGVFFVAAAAEGLSQWKGERRRKKASPFLFPLFYRRGGVRFVKRREQFPKPRSDLAVATVR